MPLRSPGAARRYQGTAALAGPGPALPGNRMLTGSAGPCPAESTTHRQWQPGQAGRGQQRGDAGGSEDVAGVVQAQHHPRQRHTDGERHQQRRQPRVVGQCDDGEGHRVQGVPGGEAEFVQRCHPGADAQVGGIRARAPGPALQALVQQQRGQAGGGHVHRGAQAVEAVQHHQRAHQDIPEHAIAEPADDREQAAHAAAPAVVVGPPAQPCFAAGQQLKRRGAHGRSSVTGPARPAGHRTRPPPAADAGVSSPARRCCPVRGAAHHQRPVAPPLQ